MKQVRRIIPLILVTTWNFRVFLPLYLLLHTGWQDDEDQNVDAKCSHLAPMVTCCKVQDRAIMMSSLMTHQYSFWEVGRTQNTYTDYASNGEKSSNTSYRTIPNPPFKVLISIIRSLCWYLFPISMDTVPYQYTSQIKVSTYNPDTTIKYRSFGPLTRVGWGWGDLCLGHIHIY